MHRYVVEVIRNSLGWWEVRHRGGRVAARYVSEFQAWEAGRALAEQCGADLLVRPEGGPATLEPYDAVTRTVRPTNPRNTGGERPLILLVEEGSDQRELYAEYLNYTGFSVITAANGHDAAMLARALRPDLILMDVRMPGMKLLEATADLKHDPAVSDIPIVAITGGASNETGPRALAAGCTAFIPKPALPRHVAAYITHFLKGEPARMPEIT